MSTVDCTTRPTRRTMLAVLGWLGLVGQLLSGVTAQPSFNRTEGVVQVGSCQGLKTKVELGLDITVAVNSDLLCAETISLRPGQDIRISSAGDHQHLVAIAEDFLVPDPTSSTLLVVPDGASLSLTNLWFTNEAGDRGSPGAVRAIWNSGTVDISTCTFESLNYAALQDGGAIYNTGEYGEVIVENSTFTGNVGKDRGGAIAAIGQGSVDVQNCTFFGNEAFGATPGRRSGSGGALYASPGMFVAVVNSSFEACMGRYGGAALFLCGGSVTDSTFIGNEADGLFGAVVNGDLSDDERTNASVALGSGVSGTYTCPALVIAGTVFEDNASGNGYGGAVASVDAGLLVFNSTMHGNVGGALYFGTGDDNGRDQLDMELIEFNQNYASENTDSFPVGAAFFVEHTGISGEADNGTDVTTGGRGGGSSATVQAVPSDLVVGTGSDLFCFQSDPYDCEGFFGQATLSLTGSLRCATCDGNAFTGIGSLGDAPTPSPAAVDDDDGLSKMGQERAQGGTIAPTPIGFGEVSSSSSASASSNASRVGDVDAEEELKLFGTSGSMRWVVVGLMVALGSALLCCLCMTVVCRSGGTVRKAKVKRRNSKPRRGAEIEEDMCAARVGPSCAAGVEQSVPLSPGTSTNRLFAISPGDVSAKKGSKQSSVRGTPLSTRKSREVARQRLLQMSVDADSNAEAGYWVESTGTWTEGGPGVASASSPARKGFVAVPGTGREQERQPSDSRMGGMGLARGRSSSRGLRGSPNRSGGMGSRSSSRSRNRQVQDGRDETWKDTSARGTEFPEASRDRSRAVKTPAGGARLLFTGHNSSDKSANREQLREREMGFEDSSRGKSPKWQAGSPASPPDDRMLRRGSGTSGSRRSSGTSRRSSGEAVALKAAGAGAVSGILQVSRDSSSKSLVDQDYPVRQSNSRRSSRTSALGPDSFSSSRRSSAQNSALRAGEAGAAAAGGVMVGSRESSGRSLRDQDNAVRQNSSHRISRTCGRGLQPATSSRRPSGQASALSGAAGGVVVGSSESSSRSLIDNSSKGYREPSRSRENFARSPKGWNLGVTNDAEPPQRWPRNRSKTPERSSATPSRSPQLSADRSKNRLSVREPSREPSRSPEWGNLEVAPTRRSSRTSSVNRISRAREPSLETSREPSLDKSTERSRREHASRPVVVLPSRRGSNSTSNNSRSRSPDLHARATPSSRKAVPAGLGAPLYADSPTGRAMMFSSRPGSRDVIRSRSPSSTTTPRERGSSGRTRSRSRSDKTGQRSSSPSREGRSSGRPRASSRAAHDQPGGDGGAGWAADLYEPDRKRGPKAGRRRSPSRRGGVRREEDDSTWSADVVVGVDKGTVR